MHTNTRRLVAATAICLFGLTSPLAAWQAVPRPPSQTSPPARPRAAAPPRNYPVRQAAATEAGPPQGSAQQPLAQPLPPQPLAGEGSPAGGALPPQSAPNMPIPQAPFTLTPSQEQLLDQILVQWEIQSDRVKTFKCSFGRWKVNETFGPKEFNCVLSEGKGYIKYKAPDHGIFRVTELSEWDDAKKAHVPRATGLDHWVCTGESIFEFNSQKRQLIERQLAPNLRGKAIANGPLPFIFGAKAAQVKQRYWMRDVTQPADVNKQIWLEAWPKRQQDAANFQHAIVVLSKQTFMPEALRIILPDGKNKEDYAFSDTQVNDPLSILKGDFLPPIKPLGWTSVYEPAEGAVQAAAPNGPSAAQRIPSTERQ